MDTLYVSYLKAALIRVFLYYKINRKDFFVESKKKQGGVPDYKQLFESIENEEKMLAILKSDEAIINYRDYIQECINEAQISPSNGYNMDRKIDYALNGNYIYFEENVNSILSGERWLMYRMFRFIYTNNKEYEKYYNLFYIYLVIKETMRSELVQTNDNLGFDNFEKYQDRKEDFIEETEFEKKYIEMAIKGTISNQSITSLEARITPKKSAREDQKVIAKYEKILENDSDLKNKFFYVFHFIKQRDEDENLENDLFCRHYQKRKDLRRQAQEIVKFRELYPRV